MCHVLLQQKLFDKLADLLDSIPKSLLLSSDEENTLKARAVIAYKRESYKELYDILSGHDFHSSNHKVSEISITLFVFISFPTRC